MSPEWDLASRFIPPVLAVFITSKLTQRRDRGAKVITYLGHASAVVLRDLQDEAKDAQTVLTHSVILRNDGRKSASNVRMGHYFLPAFTVFPQTAYTIADLPSGGKEIVIPKIVPGEQITVTYIYFPPVEFASINTLPKHDDGFCVLVPMNLVRAPSRALTWTAGALIFLGAGTVFYGVARLLAYILGLVH